MNELPIIIYIKQIEIRYRNIEIPKVHWRREFQVTLTHWETGNTLLLLLLNDILQCTLYHIDFCYVTLTYKFKQLFYYDNRNNKCPCTYPLEFWTIEKNKDLFFLFKKDHHFKRYDIHKWFWNVMRKDARKVWNKN